MAACARDWIASCGSSTASPCPRRSRGATVAASRARSRPISSCSLGSGSLSAACFERWLRHLTMPQWRAGQVLPRGALLRIEHAIAESESLHSGQIRFAVENALDLHALLRGESPRDRAVEVFAALRVWDTEHNNGVL